MPKHTHDVDGNPRLKRPGSEDHPLKPKIVVPEQGRVGFLVVFALLLVVAWLRPWDMVGESGRQLLLERQRNTALNSVPVEQVELVERIAEDNLEVELWKVTAQGASYYQVAVWEKALLDKWYAVDVADNGSWGYGWISLEQLEQLEGLDQPSQKYVFAFKHGMGSYSGTVSLDGTMSFGRGAPNQ